MNSCIAADSLERLVAGALDEQEAPSLRAHLANCPTCQKRLDTLADDAGLRELRAGYIAAALPAGVDSEVQACLQRLRATPFGEWSARDGSADRAAEPPSLGPPAQAGELGTLGPYRLLSELGRGGMGVVFKALDPALARHLAVKVLWPDRRDAQSKARFAREARAAAAVHHDHIVHIYQVAEDRGVPYLAMELLQGQSLMDRLQRPEPFSLADILRIGREIAEGLAAAHVIGLVHRDIKPANIWLESVVRSPWSVAATGKVSDATDHGPRTTDVRVKILDFGLARPVAADAVLTHKDVIVGTPAFMAPEQARGEAVGPRCDLFSLGVVLYRLCTGRLPFQSPDVVSTLVAVATCEPPPPIEVNDGLPKALSDLIVQLLAKDPARRPASAAQVVKLLQSVEEKQGQELTQAIDAPRRRSALIVVGTLVLAGLVVVATLSMNRDPNNQGAHTDLPIRDVQAAASNSTSVSDAWCQEVAALPPKEQANAVTAMLKTLNPDFDGKVEPWIEDTKGLWGLIVSADHVANISPVRALKNLRHLAVNGSGPGKGSFADLAPLKDMDLRYLSCEFTPVADLTPLENMKLTGLGIGSTQVSNLAPLKHVPLTFLQMFYTPVSSLEPLKDMKLTYLHCNGTQVSDLSPLKGMMLNHFYCEWTPVSNLTPLKDMKLKTLQCGNSKVSDLKPLTGMPLTSLFCDHTPVSDLSPLQGMPLKHLKCDYNRERDATILRSLSTLETINSRSTEEVLK